MATPRKTNKVILKRNLSSNAMTFFADGATRERLAQAKAALSEALGVEAATSVIIRCALKALADRCNAIAALGPGAETLALQ
jgi:hypothetical protein